MGISYSASQEAHHLLHDGSQPGEAEMQHATQAPVEMELYGQAFQNYWEQWCRTEADIYCESTNTALPNLYTQAQQAQQAYRHFAFDPDVSAQWAHPDPSIDSYLVSAPLTECTSSELPNGSSESRGDSAPFRTDKDWRKLSEPGTSEEVTATLEDKAVANPRLPAHCEERLNKIKIAHDRSLVATRKYRNKLREDTEKLEADTKEAERINRDLSNCVSQLTMQVCELKIQLLQHSGCNCHLIQKYIANEAQQYVQDLADGKQISATVPV